MTFSATIDPGGPKKRVIIDMARSFCSQAGYDFTMTAEEDASHLQELDAMMAEEPFSRLDYNFSDYGAGSPDDESGLSREHLSAVSKYLGLRIAPGLAKTIGQDAKAALTRSVNLLFAELATIPTMPLARGTVRGSGVSTLQPWSPFIDETVE